MNTPVWGTPCAFLACATSRAASRIYAGVDRDDDDDRRHRRDPRTRATQARRNREAEMIWRGNQYKRAIRLYYHKTGKYPQRIDDLTKGLPQLHFLRQEYKDPTNKNDGSWRFIYVNAAGSIIGSTKYATLQQMMLMDQNGGVLPAIPGQPGVSAASLATGPAARRHQYGFYAGHGPATTAESKRADDFTVRPAKYLTARRRRPRPQDPNAPQNPAGGASSNLGGDPSNPQNPSQNPQSGSPNPQSPNGYEPDVRHVRPRAWRRNEWAPPESARLRSGMLK